MPQSLRVSVVLGVLLGVIGCGSSPAAPTAPPVPDCQAHNTATLTLTNSNVLPREVYLDGADIGFLAFQGSATRTVSAGVAHPVEFRTGINGLLVSSASPNIPQCGSYTLNNNF